MALRDIATYPDPVLREHSKLLDGVDESITHLLSDMTETMYASHGIGLAAVQIGVLERVIVVDIGEGLISLINPEIIESEGESQMEEGCLCLPGVLVEVTRNEKVTVKGVNEKGKEVIIHAQDLLARALQHEIDHLNGILIIDKVSKVKRELLTSRLRKEAKERTTAKKS